MSESCRSLAIALVSLAIGTTGAVPALAAGQAQVAGAFADRLAASLESGPQAFDRLWHAGARSEMERLLDVRTSSLFAWQGVRVTVERARALPGDTIEVIVVIRGRASWEPASFEIARAFWTLQRDEDRPDFRVARRERWELTEDGGAWLARSRVVLSPVEVVRARVLAQVYPGQDALLLECTYTLRARVGGLETARFLLDQRARIYELAADGSRVELTRGAGLGSLGLAGYSPAIESSVAFPRPLAKGEEVQLTFRILSPLVHLALPDRGEDVVTSLPIRAGAYRERVWIPIFGPGSADLDVELRWPRGAFAEAALSADRSATPLDTAASAHLEESAMRLSWTGDLRFVDFILTRPNVPLASLGDFVVLDGPDARRTGIRPRPVGAGDGVARFRFDRPGRGDTSVARTRAALVGPMLAASSASTRDLASELQELLPLDSDLLDLLDDFADEGSDGSEQGADDRSSGG